MIIVAALAWALTFQIEGGEVMSIGGFSEADCKHVLAEMQAGRLKRLVLSDGREARIERGLECRLTMKPGRETRREAGRG
jgi:hypothetical protein